MEAAGTDTQISLRPMRDSDAEFLFRLFASTRPDVAMSNLGAQQKAEGWTRNLRKIQL